MEWGASYSLVVTRVVFGFWYRWFENGDRFFVDRLTDPRPSMSGS